MRSSAPPRGYEYVVEGRTHGFALSKAAGWMRQALQSHPSLHAWAESQESTLTRRGRGAVYVVPAPAPAPEGGERWAVRHYRRGGALARLLGDRYLGPGGQRPYRELATSLVVQAAGISTPTVVAGAVYPRRGRYRADLVTEFVPGARELVDVVFQGGAEADAALTAAGELLTRLAVLGIHHPDLNARNILWEGEGDEAEAWVLDLDRCTLRGSVRLPHRPMRDRLLRSLRKLARAEGIAVSATWQEAVDAGVAAQEQEQGR